MFKGKIFKILKAPENWEIIQQCDGFADINIKIEIHDNPDDDTDFEIDFSFDSVYARILNEDSGDFITPLMNLKQKGNIFECELCKIPCGGPYILDFVLFDSAKNIECPLIGERRRHFYVGDVYIIAGQSNAAGMGKGFITEKSEPGVHVLRNLKYWDIATHPFNDFDYSKQSMFLTFAKKIKEQSGCPIGLIPAAMGGSPLSRWLKDETGDLYEKLLNTLKEHTINAKAILWYQGCADTGGSKNYSEYLERFKKFVNFIRADLADDKLPLFTFQLNRQKNKETTQEDDLEYDFIREAQRRVANEIENVFVLPAIDALNMSDFIHCSKSSNIMLGERLANYVLSKLYGIGCGAEAPEISTAYYSKNELILKFKNVCEFLYAFNSSIYEFPIKAEDEKGIPELEDYDIHFDTITIKYKRELCGDVLVSGQTGSNPKNIIIDYGTQIPMLCFCKFKAEGEKKNED